MIRVDSGAFVLLRNKDNPSNLAPNPGLDGQEVDFVDIGEQMKIIDVQLSLQPTTDRVIDPAADAQAKGIVNLVCVVEPI